MNQPVPVEMTDNPVARMSDLWDQAKAVHVSAGPETVIIEGFSATSARDLASYERSVCGCMFLWPDELLTVWKNKATGITEPGKNLFTFDRTRAFFAAAIKLRKLGKPVDPIHLAKNFSEDEIQVMGGMQYVLNHLDFCFSLPNTISHLEAMVEEFRRKSFLSLLDMAMTASSDTVSMNNAITLLNEQSIKLLKSESDMQTPSTELIVDTMNSMLTDAGDSCTIPSSFRKLASFIGDYKRGQITLVGAPPANGKTAFAMQEIECALNHGFTVDAFLMESSFEQFTERYVMRNALIAGGKFRSKFFTQDEMKRAHECMETVLKYENRLHMAKVGSYTASDIDGLIQARKQITGTGCDLIVVDHLNRMTHPTEKGQSQYDAQKNTLLYLAGIAARENAVMLLMDQLTVDAVRNSFRGGSKMPGMGAFRGGVATEYAKVVLILHKDEQEMLKTSQPVVEQHIVISKANDGSTGVIPSLFLKPYAMHIEDCDIEQRVERRKWLESLNYNIETRRKGASQ